MAATTAIPDHLLHTKFYPPRVPDQLIRRQHLIDRLNEGRHRPVTLISASAGYGKSTLAHQWLAESADHFAWLSLDESDRELGIFVDYIAADLWELPVLTASQWAIKNGDEVQLTMAEKALRDCHAFALSRSNKRALMSINALLSWLHSSRGERQRAQMVPTEAILLGAPGSALRYFVGIGPALIPLLRVLQERGIFTGVYRTHLECLRRNRDRRERPA